MLGTTSSLSRRRAGGTTGAVEDGSAMLYRVSVRSERGGSPHLVLQRAHPSGVGDSLPKPSSKEALLEAIGRALDAITPEDTKGWFGHCGYAAAQSL